MPAVRIPTPLRKLTNEIEVVQTAEGWALDLSDVAALPFAVDATASGTMAFEVAPGEAATVEAWGVILDLPRDVATATAALVRAGFDASWALTFAAYAVQSLASADAREAAIKLDLRRPRLAPRKANRTPIARAA